ncbi:MAG: hypothetical protein Q8900_06825 [Bacillota bacterium]|nr:hypothetical protein [Bacillota bacterium]
MLGNTEILETWTANELNRIYKIQYDFDGFQLRVLSTNKDGIGSYLAFCQSINTTTTKQQTTYTQYRNDKFGYSIEYPSDFITKIPSKEHNYETTILPDSDKGKDLITPDGSAELIVSGDRYNMEDTAKNEYKEILILHPNATYKIQEGNWYVVSWVDENNKIVYLKGIVENSLVKYFEIKYPSDKKQYYDTVITHLNSTFVTLIGTEH